MRIDNDLRDNCSLVDSDYLGLFPNLLFHKVDVGGTKTDLVLQAVHGLRIRERTVEVNTGVSE
jgi:hypothetical protein